MISDLSFVFSKHLYIAAIDHCFPGKKKSDQYLHPWPIDLDYNMRLRLPGSPLKPSTVGFCVAISSVKLPKKLLLSSTRFWSLVCINTNKGLDNGDVYFFPLAVYR